MLPLSAAPVAAPPQRRFLPEIQALRALAVALVIVFHLWPASVPGGFVGVDVFFVISGYLITGHLLRELERTGTIRLGAFYARRARRLLPASLLVLAVAGTAGVLLLPAQLARASLREVVASTFYVENLWLASKAVTYSASQDTASAVQHFWSLSAEEQFYAAWPALILLGVVLARRAGRGTAPRVAAAGVLVVIAVASLAHSIVLTADDQAAAYFVTTTRAWEFAAGGLIGLVGRRWTPRAGIAAAARWAGVAAIVVTALSIDQATPFPGAIAAVPVVGTALIVLAGGDGPRDPLLRVGGLRPVQWLGDVSYAAYLWHWPLIALGPFALGRELAWTDGLVILAATGLLAHLTRAWVEQPFLRGLRPLTGTPLRTLVSALTAMTLLAGAALGHGAWMDRTARAQLQDRLARLAADPCLGAGAALDPGRCGAPFAAPPAAPVSEADSPWDMPHCGPGCWDGPRPAKVMAVVGDSHAQTLYRALAPLAAAEGYGLAFFLRGACPLNLTGRDRWLGMPADPDECGGWSAEVIPQILDLDPDLIVTAAYVGSTWNDPEAGTRGFHDTWARLTPTAPVVVIRDHPTTGGAWGPECLAKNAGDHAACAVERGTALPRDPGFEAAASAGPRVSAVDLSDLFCDEERCHPVVGGLPAYWDADHLTGTFARSLAPALAGRIDLP